MLDFPFKPILSKINDVVQQFIPDYEEQKKALKQVDEVLVEQEKDFVKNQSNILQKEISGESSLQRNWRPHLMYFLMAIIAWLVFIAPIMGFSDETISNLQKVPEKLWSLLTIGMGGYIAGRSSEKIIKMLKNK